MRTTSFLIAVATTALLATGCSGDEPADDRPADEVLSSAAQTLRDSSGVTLGLSSADLPSGVNGITGATGVVTDAPAFEGDLEIRLSGATFTVPVIAVDDEVWAQIPLDPSGGWSSIDPGEYGAPDPSRLIGADNGVVALLESTDSPERGDQARGGKDNSEVLTTYTGTIPGDVMERVIPSSADDTFDVTYLITEDGEVRQAVLRGVFYADSAEMTYTLDISDYGLDRTITQP